MNKKILMLVISIVLSFSLLGCEKKSQIITEEFNNTIWEEENGKTSLLFIDNNLTVNSGEIKPDMELEDIENVKYESGKYEDIEINLKDETISIKNEDNIIMEFKKISDTKIENEDGIIFIKKQI
ncbi:hypothetical protein KQI38_10220 [Tissierella carlieri]|uniref:hypothetical protein n=1 Tax=Tissierella carlieri TaxID=689904 RepID=UPI001C1122E5|nr:hypothetical protein [Tissierella carlieri]MBU5312406.1 hypothetical protein [Tissierella carlieri]MDU5081023.1 hypothetical protein [Bacillota bacterium]